jgi:hypothetical protein
LAWNFAVQQAEHLQPDAHGDLRDEKALGEGLREMFEYHVVVSSKKTS